jgi:hypothetical protein
MAIEFKEQFKSIFSNWFITVREINKKYAKPRITMTKPVAIALLALRIYLLVLVVLLFYKFITLVR